MSNNDKSKSDIKIISYWGDCVVLTLQSSQSVEVYRPDGSEITRETNERGNKRAKPEIAKQAELFDANNYSGILQPLDLDIPMSTDKRKESQVGLKGSAAMAEKEMRQ